MAGLDISMNEVNHLNLCFCQIIIYYLKYFMIFNEINFFFFYGITTF